jgi:hypothetical protein
VSYAAGANGSAIRPNSESVAGDVFTDDQLCHLSYCVGEELRARIAGKPPGPKPWLWDLVQCLETALTMSRPRQSDEGSDADSGHEEWIGTAETAAILGWTTRKVQRRKDELQGKDIGARLIFPAESIRAHAKAALNDG